MAKQYKDRRNYVDHDFVTTTVTINSKNKGEAVNQLVVDRDVDEYTTQVAGDGIGIFVRDPSQAGKIEIEFLEASASNDVMWDLEADGATFPISVLDTAVPNLTASGRFKIAKKVSIERDKGHKFVRWICITVYLDHRGGGYALAAA